MLLGRRHALEGDCVERDCSRFACDLSEPQAHGVGKQSDWGTSGQPGRSLTSVILLAVLSATVVVACQDKFGEPVTLGGVSVSPEVLNQGHTLYRQHCASCHGIQGDGRGPSADSMVPAPRNFRLAYFKFSSTSKDGLPTDDDLRRTIRHGLTGTHMPGWTSLSDEDANAVIQYVKTFSRRWEKEVPGQPVALGDDPWASRVEEAKTRGESLYHGKAECWTCHPAYAPREGIERMRSATMKAVLPASVPWRDNLGLSKPAQTVHGMISPPDFLKDQLRAGSSDNDIARTIAVGVGGTPMPAFHETLSTEDVWALAHYVQSLTALRGTPRADAVRAAARGDTKPNSPPGSSTPAQPVAP